MPLVVTEALYRVRGFFRCGHCLLAIWITGHDPEGCLIEGCGKKYESD
jgi:hypothetical protein